MIHKKAFAQYLHRTEDTSLTRKIVQVSEITGVACLQQGFPLRENIVSIGRCPRFRWAIYWHFQDGKQLVPN
jgi:hypothetical protein